MIIYSGQLDLICDVLGILFFPFNFFFSSKIVLSIILFLVLLHAIFLFVNLGTETWFYKYIDKSAPFQKQPKQNLKCGEQPGVCFYLKEYENLKFFWVLDAGHMVRRF